MRTITATQNHRPYQRWPPPSSKPDGRILVDWNLGRRKQHQLRFGVRVGVGVGVDDRGDEAISPSGDGLYETGLLGVISQSLPNLPDRAINAVVPVPR